MRLKVKEKFLSVFMAALVAFPAFARESGPYKGAITFTIGGEPYQITDVPTFEEFPAEAPPAQTATEIDWTSEKDAWRFRTVLRAGLKKGADFNGHYAVVTHGCGTSCQLNWVLDVNNGKVIGKITTSLGAQYKPDSSLIAADPVDGSTIEELGAASPYLTDVRFYKVEKGQLVLLKSINIHDEVEKLKGGKAK